MKTILFSNGFAQNRGFLPIIFKIDLSVNVLESKSQKQDTLSKEPTLKSEQFSFAKTVFFHLFYDLLKYFNKMALSRRTVQKQTN